MAAPAETEQIVTDTAGQYQIGFSDADADEVWIPESQLRTGEDGGVESETEPTVKTDPTVDGAGLGPLPAPIIGINTVLIIDSFLGALLLFCVAVALFRRGGSRNKRL